MSRTVLYVETVMATWASIAVEIWWLFPDPTCSGDYISAYKIHYTFCNMKLYAITVLFKATGVKPKKLSAAYELSSFGFFQRSR